MYMRGELCNCEKLGVGSVMATCRIKNLLYMREGLQVKVSSSISRGRISKSRSSFVERVSIVRGEFCVTAIISIHWYPNQRACDTESRPFTFFIESTLWIELVEVSGSTIFCLFPLLGREVERFVVLAMLSVFLFLSRYQTWSVS